MAEKTSPNPEASPTSAKSAFTVISTGEVTESYLNVPDIGCILRVVTAQGYVAQTFIPRCGYINGSLQQLY